MGGERLEVTSADIARISGVQPTAVSNWRRRYDDFPQPVGGTDRSPRFDLAEVEKWLKQQGREHTVPASERLWQAFEATRSDLPPEDAVGLAGVLLLYLRQHPHATVPTGQAAMARLLTRAEREFVRQTTAGPDRAVDPAVTGPDASAAADDRPPLQSIGCAGRLTSYPAPRGDRVLLCLL
jgi:hypothetical protein